MKSPIRALRNHIFRHGLGIELRQKGVDIETAQELFRHANSRIALDLDRQSLSDEKRAAAAPAFDGQFGGTS